MGRSVSRNCTVEDARPQVMEVVRKEAEGCDCIHYEPMEDEDGENETGWANVQVIRSRLM